jgi:hypothetical protein
MVQSVSTAHLFMQQPKLWFTEPYAVGVGRQGWRPLGVHDQHGIGAVKPQSTNEAVHKALHLQGIDLQGKGSNAEIATMSMIDLHSMILPCLSEVLYYCV